MGGAAGLDYHLTPDTVLGFALGGGGTNWSLSQGLGGGKSDAFQAGLYGATRWGPAVAPSGRVVYASNRGHDSIAIFAVDPREGTLTSVGWAPTQAKSPRFFCLDPSAKILY